MKAGFSGRGAIAAAVTALSLTVPYAALAATGPTAYSIFHPTAQGAVSTDLPADQPEAANVYSQPAQAPSIAPADLMAPAYFDAQGKTPVGRKIDGLQGELSDIQAKVGRFGGIVSGIENSGQTQAATYYASVATIETQLQAGTTPGNPRLLQKYQTARQALDQMSGSAQTLNDVSTQLASLASHAGYLSESVKATYGLSGAVEEDHVRLEKIEDGANAVSALIDRMLTNVTDDITRTNGYIARERNNMRTLSAAIESGSMLGKNLSSRTFDAGPMGDGQGGAAAATTPSSGGSVLGGPRQLVKIRFDHPNVNYEQPLYNAVSDALKKYPNARFALVAIHPARGNAAQIAIETTKARRASENVLRSLSQMGVQPDRVDLSAAAGDDANSSEVRLFVR